MVVLAIADVDARRTHHDHLAESGITVVDASTLDEVPALASRFFAEIAVVDLDGHGYDALAIARKLRDDGSTIAIGLTRNATPSAVAFARNAGFAAVLTAGCGPEDLFTEIVVALAGAADGEMGSGRS